MDIEHFQIIVNAMLSWQGETHAPKKSPSRPAAVSTMPRDERDELDELDDDEDYNDEEEFEPEESLNIQPEAADTDADTDAAEVADADLLDSAQLD